MSQGTRNALAMRKTPTGHESHSTVLFNQPTGAKGLANQESAGKIGGVPGEIGLDRSALLDYPVHRSTAHSIYSVINTAG
jgi:hypothetical protein